jgi:hypothetical protein
VDTDRLTAGLVRVAVAARTQAGDGLERTIGQQQILLLAVPPNPGEYALSELAAAVGMLVARPPQAAITNAVPRRGSPRWARRPSVLARTRYGWALTERGRAQAAVVP